MDESNQQRINIYYPRGFRRAVYLEPEQDTYVEVKDRTKDKAMLAKLGDTDVNELYREYRRANSTFGQTEYLIKVLDVFSRLIPDFDRFIKDQAENHYVQEHTFSFIQTLSTRIRGLSEGKQLHLSPMTAIELMDDLPDAQRVDDTRRVEPWTPVNRKGRRLSTIETWLLAENALEDIVCTLYVLFGCERSDLHVTQK